MHAVTVTLLVVATAYSPGDPAQGTGWRTATGRSARLPGVAVDPRIIPYGSQVHVPGIGWLLADDCGGAIKGRRIDVRLQDRSDCIRWGRRRLTVTVRPGTAMASRGGVRRQEPRIVHPVAAPPNPYKLSESRQAPAIEPEAGGRLASALIGGLCACAASAGAMCLILGRRLRWTP